MKFSVLIIDHSLRHVENIKKIFIQCGAVARVYEASDGTKGLQTLKDKTVDLVVCNATLPDMDGLKFLKALQALPDCSHLPVLLIASEAQMDYKAKAFELGAQEFLVRPFQTEDLLMRAKSLVRLKNTYEELHQRIQDLEKSSNVDSLTGIFNRKYLGDAMKVELRRSRRHRFTLACMMIDIDNFKSVNDTFGHTTGDHAIQELAYRLSQQLRGYDFVARYGGDEFTLLLPQSSKGGALALAERLRNIIESEPFLKREGKNIHMTISIGIAAFSGSELSDEEQLIITADRALYEAKQKGRNCIAIAESLDRFRVEPPKGLYRRNYRRYPRLPFLTCIKLVNLDTQDSTEAYAFNISYGGLGVYAQKPIAVKSRIRAYIPFTDPEGKNLEETMEGIVRWVKAFNGHYGFGIEFEELDKKEHTMTLNFIQEAERLSP
jgi:two-component system cell cycle response regulator